MQLTAGEEDMVGTTVEGVEEEKVKNRRTERKARMKNRKAAAVVVEDAVVSAAVVEEEVVDASVVTTGEGEAVAAHVQNPRGMTGREVR